jgi:tRNA uracil 4-sulfurtransferase
VLGARQIGIAQIAILPDQDCCQLFMPPRVATHAAVEQLISIEARADM